MSQSDTDFSLRFWGVRGSIPTPGPSHVRYGGNTSCMEIRARGHVIVVDAGTGIMPLGKQLAHEGGIERIDVLFTHTHYDHCCGLPFFQPAYRPDVEVSFWAGHLGGRKTLRDVLINLMIAPLFPVPLAVFQACTYTDYACGSTIDLHEGIRISTCPLNHPNGACGYRFDVDGKSICVVTDTEHVEGEIDRRIVDFVRGADIMIYDAMFTDEEFPKFRTWGHSTWQQALRIADAADVGKVVLFHHDPNHSDARMDEIVAAADALRPGTVAAKEGMVLVP